MKAGTNAQLMDSLFKPGGTVDVVIEKTTKNTVVCQWTNERLTLNKHGVLCCQNICEGKTYYHFCSSLIPSKEIVSALKIWLANNQHHYAYEYKLD